MKLKKGDKVQVIAGKEKGKEGVIVRVLPLENRVVLDALNMVKRHRRGAQVGKGQVVEKPMPIHASNVMLLDPKSGKPTRIKIVRDGKGGRSRVTVKSGHTV